MFLCTLYKKEEENGASQILFGENKKCDAAGSRPSNITDPMELVMGLQDSGHIDMLL